jgi:hypothetical protein
MESNRIHEEITHLLYKVEEQYSRIIRFNETIPIIEVDLAIKDVQDLYESFLDLRVSAELQRRKIQQAAKASEPAKPVEKTEAVKPEVKAETAKIEKSTLETPVNGMVVEEEKISPADSTPSKKTEPVIAQSPEVAANKEAVLPETPKPEEPVFKQPISLNPVAPPIVAPKIDLLKEREKDFVPTVRKIEFKPEPSNSEAKKENLFEKAASLYDKIAKPTDKTVASAASKQPISNIKSSIGINEKFTFLKDLFKNNVNDYNEALDKLNNFDSYSDAEDYFQELKSKYSWDPESKSFQGLADLLNRRYLHNA